MEKNIQDFKKARRKHLGIALPFNWYIKTLSIHEFPKVPTARFGIARGVLSKEEQKIGYRGFRDHIARITQLLSSPLITLSI